jgi:hypothetical protein
MDAITKPQSAAPKVTVTIDDAGVLADVLLGFDQMVAFPSSDPEVHRELLTCRQLCKALRKQLLMKEQEP